MTLLNLGTSDDDGTGTPLVRAGELLNALLGGVINRAVDVGSATAARGNAYIVPASATGAWSGQDNDIAIYDGSAWQFYTPTEGTEAYDRTANERVRFDGTSWSVVTSGGGGGSGERLGYAKFTNPTGLITSTGLGTLTIDEERPDGTYLLRATGDNASGWAYASVSGDFDKVFCVEASFPDDPNAGWGVYIGDTSTNQRTWFGHSESGGVPISQHFSGTSFQANGTAILQPVGHSPSFMTGRVYARVQRVSTVVNVYFSKTGLADDWVLYFTETSTPSGITDIDEVGITLQSNSVAAGDVTQCRILGVDDGSQDELTASAGSASVSSLTDLSDFDGDFSLLGANDVGRALVIKDLGGGSYGFGIGAKPAFNMPFDYSGSPGGVATLARFVPAYDITIPAGASGAFRVASNPTSAAVVNIRLTNTGGTSTIGTVSIATDGTCTVSVSSATDVDKGDLLFLESDGAEDFTDLFGSLDGFTRVA